MTIQPSRQQRRAAKRLARKSAESAGAGRLSGSKPRTSTSSPLPDRPVDKRRAIEIFNKLDSFAGVRNGLRRIAEAKEEWAGLPLPIEGETLVIHPSYPWADALRDVTKRPDDGEPTTDDVKVRNRFWSDRLRAEVYIWEEDGRVVWGKISRPHGLTMAMQTLGCSFAWGIEQEANAVQTLGRMLRHHQFKQYMLTGMFLEQSPRSGLTYLFRRLRPTVAIDARAPTGQPRILAALCLHPIGYYADTWAGSMCPTDDVIAHLALCRGDEHMFWKRANQHPPGRPEAGL